MRDYKAVFSMGLKAIDREMAEIAARKALKEKNIEATLVAIEEG